MKKVFFILLISVLTSCISTDPAPIEYGNEFSPSKDKDFKVKVIKHINNESDDELKTQEISNRDLEEKEQIDGFTVKKRDSVANKTEYHLNDTETTDETHQSLEKEVQKEFLEQESDELNNSSIKEDVEAKEKYYNKVQDTKTSHGNFTIFPTDGRIIKNFTRGSEGFEAIIFSSQKGSIIRSVSEGIVMYSGFDPKFGNIVIVTYQDFQIAYGYIKEIVVKKGSTVRVGDIIGYIGDIINSKNSGLYFAIRKNNISVDPQTLLPIN